MLFSNSKEDKKNKKLKPLTITKLFKIINSSNNNPNNFEQTNIKALCNLCIKSKYIKIVTQKKMTSTTYKLLKIYANL